MNRAYVWLSDGAVAGYRDLDTGADYPTSELQAELLVGVLTEWLRVHGVTCAGLPAEPVPLELPSGGGMSGWLARRRAKREFARAVSLHREWRLDHPTWKVSGVRESGVRIPVSVSLRK